MWSSTKPQKVIRMNKNSKRDTSPVVYRIKKNPNKINSSTNTLWQAIHLLANMIQTQKRSD